MDPITRLDRVMETLRRQMTDETQHVDATKRRFNAGMPNRAAPANQAPIQVLHRQITDRIRTIDPRDPKRQQKARRIFLESTLLWEFGEAVGRDAHFDDLLEHIQQTFDTTPEIAKQLDALIIKLDAE